MEINGVQTTDKPSANELREVRLYNVIRRNEKIKKARATIARRKSFFGNAKRTVKRKSFFGNAKIKTRRSFTKRAGPRRTVRKRKREPDYLTI